jgi:EmrB/QacA subfamily drug resistance transporter
MTPAPPATRDLEAAAPPASTPSGPWAVLAVLCVGLFMLLLDGTIVNIAIPHIMTAFETGLSSVEWVMNAYVLAFAVTLVTFGRFGDLYGRRRMYIGGMVLFTAASLACGLAPGISWLVAFRVAQGLGGAMMMPATLSIVAAVFPAGRRGAAMGVWGGVSGLATAIGPSLGGLIVDSASWRWIFLINLPIGVAGAVLALRLVPESKDPASVQTLDLPGVGLVSASLFCLTFALIEGQRLGWTSATIVALFVVSAVAFVLFYLREDRVPQPLIDFSLFRNVNFAAGNLTGLLLSASMMGVFFTIPIFLQTVLGYSALKAGLVMSPMSLVIIVAAPVAGRLSDRIGSRWIVAAGLFLLAFGIAWMAGLTPWHEALQPDTQASSLVFPFILSGIGIGLAIAPVTSAVMATAPPDRAGNASGVLSTTRQVGSLMGIAILGAVLQNRIVANVTAGVQGVPGVPETVKRSIIDGVGGGMQMGAPEGGGGMPEAVRTLTAALFRGWFTDAINTTFIVGVAFAAAGGFCALLLRSHVGAAEGAATQPVDEGHGAGARTDPAPAGAGPPALGRRPA